MKLSKNFDSKEFICPCCGQGEDRISPELVYKLQQFRDYVKLPIIVLSGFRCSKRNAEVGGAPESRHLVGEAADISIQVKSGENAYKALTGPEILILLHKSQVKFSGIGIGQRYLHVDVRTSPAMWFYDGVLKWDTESSRKSSPDLQS
jgi:hypothetical protein